MNEIVIEDFIPHRDRMKLIDEVITVSDISGSTTSTTTELWPLYSAGFIHPLVLIELVAQTTGLIVGISEKDKSNRGGEGWLVGIKKAEFNIDAIPVGIQLHTSVHSRYQLKNYLVAEGIVSIDSEIIGQIMIQVFRMD